MKPASAFPASARRQLTFEQAALAMSATVCELGVIRAQESITIDVRHQIESCCSLNG
jgi:uncharacterized protein YijF (DUF1287 family)